MQTKPANWDTILASEHITDAKVTVDGVEYGADAIDTLQTSGALYDEFGIGNCCSRMLLLTLRPTATPARQAEVQVQCRLNGEQFAWNKYNANIAWDSIMYITIFSNWVTLKGYTSCKATYSRSKNKNFVVGAGDSMILSGTDENPITEQQLQSFFASYPYWIFYGDEQKEYYDMFKGGSNFRFNQEKIDFRAEYFSISKGNFVETITSFYEDAYPEDACQDGYWYSKTSSLPYYTSYIQKGTFFISKRETDHSTGTLKLTCYDAMLRAEQPFTTVFDDAEDFPMNPTTCVSAIATAMGITVDSRTSLNNSFLVEYPVDEDGDMTLREILGRISVANAGNWIITDNNQLRLVPLASAATPIALGANCKSLEKGITSDAIGKVEVIDNSGELLQEWPFGTFTGKVLTATYPDATPNGGAQTQAANDVAYAIYTAVSGYVQCGFLARNSIIDPCAELGDRVTVGTTGSTITSTIANEDISFKRFYTADISAPDADEVDDEYPYQTQKQKVERKISGAYSKISKTASEIQAEVNALDGSVSALAISVSGISTRVGTAEGNISTLQQTASSLQTQINGKINGTTAQSMINQTLKDITLSVTSDSDGSSISLTNNGVTVTSSLVDLHVQSVNIDGTITADAMTASCMEAIEISASQITSGIIVAGEIEGDIVTLRGDNGKKAATFEITGSTVWSGRELTIDSGSIILSAQYSNISFKAGGNFIESEGDFIPWEDAAYDLGWSRGYWNNIYCYSSAIDLSDRNEKEYINYEIRIDDLFDKLKPASFKMKRGTSNRTHYGMIAQDVEVALQEVGMTSDEFAGIVISEDDDGDVRYGLRYGEFVSLCIDQIQKLKARVRALEETA